MKIECPHCKKNFDFKNPFNVAGGKNRWDGVSKAERSAMAIKAWKTRKTKESQAKLSGMTPEEKEAVAQEVDKALTTGAEITDALLEKMDALIKEDYPDVAAEIGIA